MSDEVNKAITDAQALLVNSDVVNQALRSTPGMPGWVYSTLRSLDAMSNSIACTVLGLLIEKRQTEAMILMRSLLEAHAKFVYIVSREKVDKAAWEYNRVLPWHSLFQDFKKINDTYIPLLEKLKRESARYPFQTMSFTDDISSLRARAAHLKPLTKDLPVDPETGKRISRDDVQKIATKWEWRRIVEEISNRGLVSFLYLIERYSFYSKMSHFDSTMLVEVPRDLKGVPFHATENNQALSLLYECLAMSVDRYRVVVGRFRLTNINQEPGAVPAEFVKTFRILLSLGFKDVSPIYLGAFTVKEVDGNKIVLSLRPD